MRSKLKKMNVFIQKLNPMTGNKDWIVQNESYDYHQEIARSAFADMLHDVERNKLYERGLKIAIKKIHDEKKEAKVLDIGTGTGLLAMMAARNGADKIIACEAFKPMSECAVKIIELNGFKDKIRVINKRSTELTVGSDGDLIEKCNILVTEVFDTELIGEGALSTFRHAHEHLLEQNCIIVPNSASIYAQVIESELIQSWNKLEDINDVNNTEILIKIPDNIKNCMGSASVHDIQMSQLPLECFKTITNVVEVFKFDFTNKTKIKFNRHNAVKVKSKVNGRAQAVFMWWDLKFDEHDEIVLSCAPNFLKNNDNKNWRDHWMQAVYFLPKEIYVEKNQEIILHSNHDEYSLWFGLNDNEPLPYCKCMLHVAYSRMRLGQINDGKRLEKYLKLLNKHLDKDTTVLFLSESFLYGLRRDIKKSYHLETVQMSQQVLKDLIVFNGFNNIEIIEDLKQLTQSQLQEIDVVMSEPFFFSSLIPWDNLLFSYLLHGIKPLLKNDVKIFPNKAKIKCVPMKFDNLQKIRCPLHECEGFKMQPFDELIQSSSTISDDTVEPQPLWEYPGIALSDEVEIVTLNLVELPESSQKITGSLPIKHDGECNGVALWMEWDLDGDDVLNTGPISSIEIGKEVKWDMNVKQGVVLFPNKKILQINYEFNFDFKEGLITFNCV